MNINWDEKPEWADVWLESFTNSVESGWRMSSIDNFGGEVWQAKEGNFWSKNQEAAGSYKIHHHPETKPEWNGEGLPPVGESFDFSYNGVSWEERIMLYNDGITCLMAHKKYPSNRWHYKCDDPCIRCHPIKSDKEKWVEQLCETLGISSDGSEWLDAIYDALKSGELPTPKGLDK